MRISDWSSDVCSSDLNGRQPKHPHDHPEHLCAAERQAKLLDCIIHREGIVEPQVVAVSGGEECEDEATSIEQGSDANLQIVLSQMARRQARKIHDVPQCCGNRGPREEKPGIAPGITKPKAYKPGHHNAGGCTCIKPADRPIPPAALQSYWEQLDRK